MIFTGHEKYALGTLQSDKEKDMLTHAFRIKEHTSHIRGTTVIHLKLACEEVVVFPL